MIYSPLFYINAEEGRILTFKQKLSVILVLTLACSFLLNYACSPRVHAYDFRSKRVLIIDSYSPDEPWEQSINKEIVKLLQGEYPSLQCSIEYLNAMGVPDFDSEKMMNELKLKYGSEKFDLIITNNEEASIMMKKHHDKYFPKVPVLFCGVNSNFYISEEDRKYFTGVLNAPTNTATLDMALALHGSVKKVYILLDQSNYGKLSSQTLGMLMSFYDKKYSVHIMQTTNIDQALVNLKHANHDSLIMLLGTFTDNNGKHVSPEDTISRIKSVSTAPIYSSWQAYFGKGIVGGAINDGEKHGKLAGRMALRILNGENPADIPVLAHGDTTFRFDYAAMNEYHVSMNDIPQNSIIINKPKDTLPKYFKDLLTAIVIGFILVLSAMMIHNNHIKKKNLKNKFLYEEMLKYDELKTEFFSNISHELRTPLNVILCTLQLLKHTPPLKGDTYSKGELEPKLDSIRRNSLRLLRLVNNLIDITKIDSGFYKLHLKNENIVDVVEDITLSVADYVNDKEIELTFDTEMEERIMAVDSEKIERIMLNLLSNAVKFTPADGKILVYMREDEENVYISVADTGIGIPEDKHSLIFERFRQVDSTMTRNTEGSGIGLSLVKALVELHDGTITVESEQGEGSTFAVTIPVRLVAEDSLMCNKNLADDKSAKVSTEFSDLI